MMARSEARLTVARPGLYLQRLCKHFAAKLPATYTQQRGQILFSSGTCKLEAQDGLLIVVVEADDEATVSKLEDVVTRQLERLAERDRPTIAWASLAGLKF
jgi:hypothetical protein